MFYSIYIAYYTRYFILCYYCVRSNLHVYLMLCQEKKTGLHR